MPDAGEVCAQAEVKAAFIAVPALIRGALTKCGERFFVSSSIALP
jgi:hypothetical protein